MTNPLPVEQAFQARTDLRPYQDSARMLFALQLRFDIEDVHTLAASALIDNPLKEKTDDKKCDVVYLDQQKGVLVVVQGYESRDSTKDKAKSNKACDLNTAATWLLSRPVTELPHRLKSVATEVRTALGAGDIASVQFWYVHNLPESSTVKQEMEAVGETVRNTIIAVFGQDNMPEEIAAIEVGLGTQEEWYRSLAAPVLVTDKITSDVVGAFVVEGESWQACVTAVSATLLRDLYRRYGPQLFSANYRDYLGTTARRRDRDINSLIQDSAGSQPRKFWVYNNGVTAIVSDFALVPQNGGGTRLTITGISIVNGAQTTGSLGSMPETLSGDILVPIRFIKCTDAETVADIVRFNNSQNPLLPADYKSNDPVQRRLRAEFSKIEGCTYTGGRRGTPIDRLTRSDEQLSADTCAQALAAFHQRPEIAYHRKAEIWRHSETYQRFFNERTTARHILFAYSLLKCIENHKRALRQLEPSGKLSDHEEHEYEFLCQRGATLLLAAAIANSLEIVMGTKITNPFALVFEESTSRVTALEYWKPLVESLCSFATQLATCAESGIRDAGQISLALKSFGQMVSAVRGANKQLYDNFSRHVRRS